MNGAVEHYKACSKHGIKPILGLEAYFVDDRKTEAVRYERNHLTLLAASDEGFRNLVKLSSAGFLEGYRRGKANVDLRAARALLGRRHRPHRLPPVALLPPPRRRHRRPRRAPTPTTLIQVFGADDVYFEVQKNGVAEQDKANEGIVRIARELGRPLVGDRRRALPRPRGLRQPQRAALRADQEHARRAEAVASTPTSSTSRTRTRWRPRSPHWPEAIATTLEIAERCEVEMELGKMLIPRFPTPDGEPEEALPAPRSPRRACAGATATRRRPRRSSGSRWSSA